MSKRYLLASLLIHSLILLHLGLGSDGSGGRPAGDGQQAGSPKHDEIRPKVVEVEMREVSSKEKEPQLPAVKQVPNALRECEGDKWYGGIGVEENFLQDLVMKVYPGYPAAMAGIQAGDKIITVDGMPTTINDVRGKPGTTATITVSRGGALLTFTITRDKICTER